MAFGSSMKEAPKQATGDIVFDTPTMPTKSGRRIFRVLPTVDDSGNLIDQAETRWLEVWWTVNIDSPQNKRRIILDWHDPFNSPIWDFVQSTTEKGSKERRAIMPKHKFALNVLDRTPVIILENGQVVYQDEKNKWVVSAQNKFIPEVKGDYKPVPLNKVRILEGSAGQAGGKHLLQNLATTAANIDNPKGDGLVPLYGVDLRLSTTGTEFDNTNRSFYITMNFAALTPEELALPRYDLDTWTKPWPNGALQAILAGEPFDEIVANFGIQSYPKLFGVVDDAESVTEPKVKSKKSTAKKNVFDEDVEF